MRVLQSVRSPPLGIKLVALFATALVLQPLSLLLGRGMSHFGIIFPLGLGLLLGLLVWFRQPVSGWIAARRWRVLLWRAILLFGGLWLASVVLFFAVIGRAGHLPEAVQGPVAAVIVLGSSTPNGRPSEALQARLDAAHRVAQQFPQALLAVSGGVDFGETLSEGEVMGDYLRALGLSAERIVQEEASTSTDLNLQLTQPLLAARGIGLSDPIVVVTSDFHVWRAARIARRQGWHSVQLVGSAMPLEIRYNAWLREYFAMLSSWLLGEM